MINKIFIKLSLTSILKSACEIHVEVFKLFLFLFFLYLVLSVFVCSEVPTLWGTLYELEFEGPNPERF